MTAITTIHVTALSWNCILYRGGQDDPGPAEHHALGLCGRDGEFDMQFMAEHASQSLFDH
jgi:hypothetical protein